MGWSSWNLRRRCSTSGYCAASTKETQARSPSVRRLPVVSRVIALTLDDSGLPKSAEQRIGIAMLDSADWVALFLGAIKAGIVPVAMNTLLTPADIILNMVDRARHYGFLRRKRKSSELSLTYGSLQAAVADLKETAV